MMKIFKSTDQVKFFRTFSCEDDCRQYLFNMKWKKGYQCRKCGCKDHGKGRTPYHLRCRNCGYDESPTIGTSFSNMKFPLLKAFHILFHVANQTNGISTLGAARAHELNPKTTWRFLNKMQLSVTKKLMSDFDPEKPTLIRKMDGATISHRGKGLNGLQQAKIIYQVLSKKKLALVPIPLEELFPFSDIKEKSELLWGHYVKEGKDINIWNLKVKITGTHHHCSAKYLMAYVAECIFRFNTGHKPKTAWHALLECFMHPETHAGGLVGN